MLDPRWEDENLGPRERPRATPVRLAASDGVPIGATLTFATTASPIGVVVVAGAMAVRANRYGKLAASFARSGYHVLTFDYRGVGDSLEGSVRRVRARLHEWGERDLAAVLAHAEARFPELPLFFIGHSVGGQLFGLVPPGRVRAAALFASQSGYFGHWAGPGRAAMAAIWHVLVPGLAGTFGYLPMGALGRGEDVPRGVALEWASWGRDPRYFGRWVDEKADRARYFSFKGPMKLYSFSDDPYAPKRAVSALRKAYAHASVEHLHVDPKDVRKRRIGHFALLRPTFEDTLWASAKALFADAARSSVEAA
jgi:predicted alpha/beta hydrolase